MKKMLFLMLFLIILGAASVNAQVRIGGNGQPNPAAVLDLNADNTVTGTKGLALPRVSLTDVNTALTGSPTVNGMIVYNTNTTLGAGIYYWDTNKWVKVSDGSFSEGDGIVGNEVADTITGGGLIITGAGTSSDPKKIGIKTTGVAAGSFLRYDGSQWVGTPILYQNRIVCPRCDTLKQFASVLVRIDTAYWFNRIWASTCNVLGSTNLSGREDYFALPTEDNRYIRFHRLGPKAGNMDAVLTCILK